MLGDIFAFYFLNWKKNSPESTLVELFFSCAWQDFTQDVSTVLDFLDQELQEDHAHERKKFIKVVGIVNNFFSTSNAIL